MKRIIFSITIAALIPRLTFAQVNIPFWDTEKVIAEVINLFRFGIAKVISFFAFVLNWTFDIQEITNIDVIQFAWSVSRDFANMFFILILLAIAFATILRYEPYGIKRLLPKLVLVALLINFSMVGAGVIIDLGSSLGHFFVTGGAYNESAGDVGANIGAALGVSNLNNYTGSELKLEGVSDLIVDALFSLVLTGIVAFLFIIMAGLMLVRLMALWLLVIFLPLALIAWILPTTKRYWSMWWDKFFAWAFFPAIFGIFIYFGLIIGNAFKTGIFTELGSGVEDSSWFTVSVQSFIQMLIVVFILMAGLKYARSAGLDGAGLVVKWGDKARDAALGYTKNYAKTKATLVGGALSERALYGVDKETGKRTKARLITRGVSGVPGLGKALKPAMGLAEKRKKQIADRQGDFDKMDGHHLQTLLRSATGDEAVAIGLALSKKKEFNTKSGLLSEEKIATVMKRAIPLGLGKELVLANAAIAVKKAVLDVEKVADIVSKARPTDVAEKFSPTMLEDVKKNTTTEQFETFMKPVIERWGPSHVQKMSEENQTSNLYEFDQHIINQTGGAGVSAAERAGWLRKEERNDPADPSKVTKKANYSLASFIEKNPAAASFLQAAAGQKQKGQKITIVDSKGNEVRGVSEEEEEFPDKPGDDNPGGGYRSIDRRSGRNI